MGGWEVGVGEIPKIWWEGGSGAPVQPIFLATSMALSNFGLSVNLRRLCIGMAQCGLCLLQAIDVAHFRAKGVAKLVWTPTVVRLPLLQLVPLLVCEVRSDPAAQRGMRKGLVTGVVDRSAVAVGGVLHPRLLSGLPRPLAPRCIAAA